MSHFRALKKIIWAVDAFEEADELRHHTLDDIRYLAKRTCASVEPVYVFSPEQLNLAIEFTPPWYEHYSPATKKKLNQLLEGVNIPSLRPPKVIIQNVASTTRSVKALSTYASEISADLIVASTHGRKGGMAKLILGSFAESLLQHSTVPVLMVGPRSHSIRTYDHILFPTDLSAESDLVFQRVVDLAASLDAQLTIFHAIQHPIPSVLESGVYLLSGGWISVRDYLSKEEDQRRKHAEGWAELARKRGIGTQVVIDRGGKAVADAILDHTKHHHISLIAMAAHSGPIAMALLGSITWKVVRSTVCPVWVTRISS